MDDFLARAERLRRKSRYREALVLYKLSIRGTEGEERLVRLIAVGDTYRMTGEFIRAEKYYSDAVELGRKLREVPLTTDAYVGLGLSKRALGDWKGSLRLLDRAEKTYGKLKDSDGMAFTLWARAGALRIKGDIPEAIKTFRAAYRAFCTLEDDYGMGYSLCGLGGTTRVRGLYEQSLKHYGEANVMFCMLRDKFGTAYSHCGIGNALRMMGDFEAARDHFRKAIALYRRIGDIVSYSYTLWSMGKAYMMLGRYSLSEKYLNDAMRHFRKTKDPRGIIYCKLGLAELRAIGGKEKLAAGMLASASQEAGTLGFGVEKCHARALLSSLEGPADNKCYKDLRLRLKFKTIPFNIP